MSILVVDDEADVRELLAYALEGWGAEVRVAADADAARAAVVRHTPHVLISDIAMPDEDGYSLIRSIRALAHAHELVAAIALTAFTHPADRARALGAGFDLHMGKPVQPWRLAEAICEMASAARRGVASS